MNYLGNDDLLLTGDEELNGDEILGGDQILGADLDAYLGVDNMRSKMALARRVALARSLGGNVVRTQQGGGMQEQVLPIPRTSVLTLQTVTIQAFPQRLFRTERFVVASQIAAFFDLNDLSIGQDRMFVSTGAVPCSVFSEVGVGVRLRGFTANLGNTISVTVTNNTGVTQVFQASIIGTTVVQ